jgi:hypothetical protein
VGEVNVIHAWPKSRNVGRRQKIDPGHQAPLTTVALLVTRGSASSRPRNVKPKLNNRRRRNLKVRGCDRGKFELLSAEETEKKKPMLCKPRQHDDA